MKQPPSELPLGLGMALAQNKQAMTAFVALSEEEKRAVIAGGQGIGSPAELRRYVASLAQTDTPSP